MNNSAITTISQHANNKGQHKHMSLIECVLNVVVGYILMVLIQYLIYPIFGITIPAGQALFISGLIVLISFIKNYTIRRIFNAIDVNGSN